MTKIDKRKNYYMVLDTETANDINQPFVFDIGGAIVDKKGYVYETFSFINREVFYDMPELMAVCFYQSKLPMYHNDIENSKRIVKNWFDIKCEVANLCKKYNVKAIMAHNTNFDYRACNTTQRYITKSKYRYFFPYGVEIWDTLKMATDTICKQKSYIKFCETNGFLKKNGTPRATAEILYKYIINDLDFKESHTALEDVLIEKEIFSKCMRQHKKMRKRLFVPKEKKKSLLETMEEKRYTLKMLELLGE